MVCNLGGVVKPRYRLLYLLLIVAVLLRAFIPDGYMPNQDKSGSGPAITICTVGLSAPMVLYLNLDDTGDADEHIVHPILDCAFGTVLQLDSLNANLPLLVLGLLLFLLVRRLTFPLLSRFVIRAGPPLGPRGPPTYS